MSIKKKEVITVYEEKDGRLRVACSIQLLLISVFLFWLIPIIAIIEFIIHTIKRDHFTIYKKDYHRHNFKYYEGLNDTKEKKY